jgi:predicted RNase H-like nuclease
MFVGVDRCKAGWFIAALDESLNWAVDIAFTIDDRWAKYKKAEIILIDIPIGLRESGPTELLCDLAARQVLGSRKSSVFPAPCRQALSAQTYEEASRWNDQITGRRLSKQSWAILPAIREIDTLLAKDQEARTVIREMHPEVCFWGLNRRITMPNYKKDDEGFRDRIALLEQFFPSARRLVEHTLATYRSSMVSRDDVVDALVGAVTASGGSDCLATLPDVPERDSRDLPMEMVYRVI